VKNPAARGDQHGLLDMSEKICQVENQRLQSENDRLLEKLRKEALEKSLLLEISKTISSSLDIKEVLNRIVDSVRQVIPYDAAGIFLLDPETKQLKPAVLRGYDHEAIRKAHLKVGRGLIGQVAKTQKGGIFADVSKEPNYIDARKETRSQISVPLMVKGKLLGVLNLESDRLNAFDENDLNLLKAFASHAAIAIENARLHHRVLKNRELEYDLHIARRIQKALLPKKLPEVPGYEFATINIPSKTVSGDLYDLSKLPNGKLAIAIGDVSGKGTPAAIIMASVYSAFKTISNEPISVSQRICRLNELIHESMMPGTYATFFYGELDITSRRFVYCNAGHFPPVLVRNDGTTLKLVEGGTVLGFLRNMTYQEHEVILEEGDILFCYTDGLVEVSDKEGSFLNLDPFVEIVQENRERKAREILDRILQAFYGRVRRKQLEDDLTIILTKVLPQPE